METLPNRIEEAGDLSGAEIRRIMEEKKLIRFKKGYCLKVGGKELRFREDDLIEIGEGMEIDERTARDLIKNGTCVPGDQYGVVVAQRFEE
jgi:hypothetical protein